MLRTFATRPPWLCPYSPADAAAAAAAGAPEGYLRISSRELKERMNSVAWPCILPQWTCKPRCARLSEINTYGINSSDRLRKSQ